MDATSVRGMMDGDAARLGAVVRWNTLVLAACTAINWAVVLLFAALGAITSAELTGQAALAGVAPFVFLVGTALGAFVMGRLMDRFGRVPVIAFAFVLGAAGGLVIFFAIGLRSAVPFFGGMALVGVTNGTVGLARAAAADMYPPARRGRGIGYVLVGAAVGVVGGGLLFGSLLGASRGDLVTLAAPWPLAAALMALGAAVVLTIRVDPLTIGRQLRTTTMTASRSGAAGGRPVGHDAADSDPRAGVHASETARRSLAEIFRPAGMRSALVAVIVAQLVMTSAMSLIPVYMRAHAHDLGTVSLTISSHLIGMFVLSPVLGPLTDRIGRGRALVVGLAILAGAVLGLELGDSPLTLLPAMFLVGVGWNVSYVAATAMMGDGSAPQERAGALGSADLLALLSGAAGAAVAGALLAQIGFGPLAVSAALIALLPALLLWRVGRGRIGWSVTPAS